MPLGLSIPFYLAILMYIVSAGLALRFIRGADARVLFYAKRVAAVGNTFLLVVFVVRWWTWQRIPLTGMGDSLNLFLILCTGIMLTVQRNDTMRPLLCFYLPALALLAIVAGTVSPQFLSEEPKALNGIPLIIHVGLLFFSFALFYVASVTSLAYVYKAQHLKRKMTTGLPSKLPSLEQLDKALYGLIRVGYPTLVITLFLGLFWVWVARDLLDEYWYVSRKIGFSALMLLLYSVSFHTRRIGWLRGPRLAYLVVFSFAVILLSYLALELIPTESYAFWGAST